jgi:hypothetical protein
MLTVNNGGKDATLIGADNGFHLSDLLKIVD